MQITIKRGENLTAVGVLTAVVNTVFYEDGSPWEPDADQVKGLVEIFGELPVSAADPWEARGAHCHRREVQLTGGDTAGAAIHGKLRIDVDLETRSVEVEFPADQDVPSHVTLFAEEDWDAIVTAINAVELHRGAASKAEWR